VGCQLEQTRAVLRVCNSYDAADVTFLLKRFHTSYGVTVFATPMIEHYMNPALMFPYALWRDRVCNTSTAPATAGRSPAGFHTPYGVTVFATEVELTVILVEPGFHTPYGVTVFATFGVPTLLALVWLFPYALWRDRVCNPTRVARAVTSADVIRLQGPPSKRVARSGENAFRRVFVLAHRLHR
jgi:hypothetical protein